MKKRIVALCTACFLALSTVPAFAGQQKAQNVATPADYTAYIDRLPICTYIYYQSENGYYSNPYVLAEDLPNYGFQVNWNGKTKTLNITLPKERKVKNFSPAEKAAIQKAGSNTTQKLRIYPTNMKVLFDGQPISCENERPFLNVGGKTLVLMSALGKHFGDFYENPKDRIIDFYTKGNQLPIATYTTDFGLEYQETERLPLPKYFSVGETMLKRNKNIYGTIYLDFHNTEYLLLCSDVLNGIPMEITSPAPNEIAVNMTGKRAEAVTYSATVSNYPTSFFRTNLVLKKGDQIIENPDAPSFISIDHELYVNIDALTEALDTPFILAQRGLFYDNIYKTISV